MSNATKLLLERAGLLETQANTNKNAIIETCEVEFNKRMKLVHELRNAAQEVCAHTSWVSTVERYDYHNNVENDIDFCTLCGKAL